MPVIEDFRILEELKNDGKTVVYRAERGDHREPVIVKTLVSKQPDVLEIKRLTREYELLSKLQIDGVPRALDLIENDNGVAMVMEDHGLPVLSQIIQEKPLSIAAFLPLAIDLTRVLGAIHHAGIIHKDIKPSNILVDLENSRVYIIDFNIVTQLPQQLQNACQPESLEGTLAYMSPEQTGRMNRKIDYRSDYYSLGITFYEMLTQRLPFAGEDALSIIHAHIVKSATSLYEIRADIPKVINDIVMKLLAKTAEERYQSSYGIRFDLQLCLEDFQRTQQIKSFPIGQQDLPETFQISQKLYGRDREIALLEKAFHKVSTGTSTIALISGQAGIGKTSLIHEVDRLLLEAKGTFCQGKFEQLQHDMPYSAWIKALKELVDKLLVEPEHILQTWREKIRTALGENGQIIVDFIPELEDIIGEQADLIQLEPEENENRLYWTLKKFIQLFAEPKRPLVIFLDDLHWADLESIKLIENLFFKNKIDSLFLILSYRPVEIEFHSILHDLIERINKDPKNYYIDLDYLSLNDIENLLIDTLHRQRLAISDIAEICYEKTLGNPFFADQLLLSLSDQKLIFFNETDGIWDWDIKEIRKKSVTKNVVEYLIEKISKLPNSTQEALKFASCIGSKFDLIQLSNITDKTIEELREALWPAIKESFLIPLQQNFETGENEESTALSFSHDRLQQAVYDCLDRDKRKFIHLRIAREMLKKFKGKKLKNNIFIIVNHLNQGIDEIKDENERIEVVELNLEAVKKSQYSSAFEQAQKYARICIELLPENAWEENYQLTLQIYQSALESEFSVGNEEKTKKLTKIILANSKNIYDALRAYEIKIRNFAKENRHADAVKEGVKILRKLGLKLPKKPKKINVLANIIKLKLGFWKKGVSQLADLPTLQNEEIRMLMRMAGLVIVSCVQYSIELAIILSCRIVNLTLKNGVSMEAIRCYMPLIPLFWVLGDIQSGQEMRKVIQKLLERFPANKDKGKILFAITFLGGPWSTHLENVVKELLDVFHVSLELGDEETASMCISTRQLMLYFSSAELETYENEFEKYVRFSKKSKQKMPYNMLLRLRQLAENFRDPKKDPFVLTGTYCKEEDVLEGIKKSKNKMDKTALYMSKSFLAVYFEDYDKAYNAIKELNINDMRAVYGYSMLVFFGSLIYLKKAENANFIKRILFMRKVKSYLKMIKVWSNYAPSNFLHKYYLVKARCNEFNGHYSSAAKDYDTALALAKKYHFSSEAGLIAECAADFYLKFGSKHAAETFYEEALFHYQRWGATAKVVQLIKKYQNVFDKSIEMLRKSISGDTQHTHTSTTFTHSVYSQVLDLETVLKASQAISGEIIPEQLIEKLLTITLENAGADRCLLIIIKNQHWYVEGEYSSQFGFKHILSSIPLKECENIPLNVIEYVQRTKESLVLNDAPSSPFAEDLYIAAEKPLSILCHPILYQGQLIGLFYFENKIVPDVFTPQKIQLLKPLASQAAISIENSRLYSSFERFVPKQFLNLLGRRSVVDVQLGDSIQKELTILFMDIRGFSSLAEKLSPELVFQIMNRYLSYIEPIVTRHNGFIDKYIGDGVMALFPRAADDALRASIEMREALIIFNEEELKKSEISVENYIGMNLGTVMLGTIGSKKRIDGSVIGDAVNSASRIMDLNRIYGTSILLSGQMREKLSHETSHVSLRQLDRVRVKGKLESLDIWEVFSYQKEPLSEEQRNFLENYAQGLEFYRAGYFAKAKEKFFLCLQLFPSDKASELLLNRCRDFIANGAPPDWDGVITYTTKS